MCLVLKDGGGVFREITVWGLFQIPSQAQSFINKRGSGHELVDQSNNDNICGPATEKKSLNFDYSSK